MSKIFICDNCGLSYPSPLDEERILDDKGVLQTYDLDAPCRQILHDSKESSKQDFVQNMAGAEVYKATVEAQIEAETGVEIVKGKK